MTKRYLQKGMAFSLLVLSCLQSKAQSIEQKLRADKSVSSFELNKDLRTPSSITFAASAKQAGDARALLRNYFPLDAGNDLQLVAATELANNVRVEKYRQYFKGIPVEHSAYNLVSKGGTVIFVQAESYPVAETFSTAPALNVEAAKSAALNFVQAKKYAWEALEEDKRLYPGNASMQLQLESLRQQYLPKGELVIAKDQYSSKGARLAYKFDVYAVQPLGRYLIYVDAQDGHIMLRDAVIKHADKADRGPKPDSLSYLPNYRYYNLAAKNQIRYWPQRTAGSVMGTAQTRYSGLRQIYTTKISVPALGGQDPNAPQLPLTYSGVDPRLPVLGRDVYILKDDTRGGGIETYDLNAVGGAPVSLPGVYSQALAFVDKDNNWKDEADNGVITQEDLVRGATRDGSVGAAEAGNDDIAIDAHWGAGVVYDYWKQVHQRLSFDNKNSAIKSYVHYGPAYDNAFWNGSVMTYGDGSGTSVNSGFRPLTSLDVCGHEIGHGVCSFTADLVYQGESGAMNEGLSDIWAACIERFAKLKVDPNLNYQFFQVGEQIAADNIGLRRMDNPKSKTDPDTYGGRYWSNPNCTPTLANDQCGVHTNSGVLNHWFYLLVQGPKTVTGSPAYTDDGIADAPGNTAATENTGNNYGALANFLGLGFDKAEQITYLMEMALTPNATYADARAASINAAKALYGACSQEEISTTNAWFAVNVGAAWSTCTAPTLSVNLITNVINEGSGECGSYTDYPIGISLTAAQATATTIRVTVQPSTTAKANDYALSTNSITYNAGQTGLQGLTLRVYNDDIVEGDETVVLRLSSSLKDTTITLTIKDDDVLPKLGNLFTLLNEDFESTPDDQLPAGWTAVNKTSPSGGEWNVRQSPSASPITWVSKRAYIYPATLAATVPALKGQAIYDNNTASQVILRTPLIDARGFDSVKLRFRWSGGGEAACSPACDYGEVVYSFDGVNFNRFSADTSRGSGDPSYPLYLSPFDSTYNQILGKQVSNRQFYLGFRWINDANGTTAIASITIDSVNVVGIGRKIESDSASVQTTAVPVEPTAPVFFYSKNDKGLLSSMVNASADLGCVKDTLIQAGAGTVPYSGGRRTRKAHELTATGNGSYTLTLYYTLPELAGFSAQPSQLRILKTTAASFDAVNGSNMVIITPTSVIDSSAQGFYGFVANVTGFGKFALVEAAGAPLPLNCLAFTATKGNNEVALDWRTGGEAAGTRYDLERSADGANYQTVATLASNGNGSYRFVDRSVSGLKSALYRVKATEPSGAVRYLCSTLQVNFDGRNTLLVGAIYPNPGKGDATVNVSLGASRKLRAEYVNNVGQTLNVQQWQVPAGATRLALNVQALAAGSYLVRFRDEDGTVISTQTYLKQ